MSSPNQLIKNNYHTHMYLCRHASGNVEDYVKEAIRQGLDSIGMSDHAPWAELVGRSDRMDPDDFPIYLEQLRTSIEKYQDKIKIYKGVEIEYFSNKEEYYESLLKELDYLVLGQHYVERGDKLWSAYRLNSVEEMTLYKDQIIKAMATGYFKFVAHPDLFLFHQGVLSQEVLDLCEEIVIAAKVNNIPLEINGNGFRKKPIVVNGQVVRRYPREEFWLLVKKHGARVIISSDAHEPNLLIDDAMSEALEFARALGLTVEVELKF